MYMDDDARMLAHGLRLVTRHVASTYVTRFLYDAVPTSKTGLPRGRLVLVTSPKRERYHVSIFH
jgi:hypothetical protein